MHETVSMPIMNTSTNLQAGKRRILFVGVIGFLLFQGGCGPAEPTLDWTSPENIATIASAQGIAKNPEFDALCRSLMEGRAEAMDEYELMEIEGPFKMTAYAAPVLEARRHPDDRYRHPIRTLPTNHQDGDALPKRSELSSRNSTDQVLGWVENGLDAYLAEVNGSVRLRFADASEACLAWIATNEQPYTSLGRLLVDEGHVPAEEIDLDAIRAIHDRQPELVEGLMLQNDRAVFFESIDCSAWPRAASGAVLVPDRSVAVDPTVIPLGSVLVIQTTLADGTRLNRIVAAVDIGGAIKGRRMDLYMGAGEDALARAGRQVCPTNVFQLVRRSKP